MRHAVLLVCCIILSLAANVVCKGVVAAGDASEQAQGAPNYADREYWETRYSQEEGWVYDWLLEYEHFKAQRVHEMLRPSDEILMLGCGSADFSAAMYDDGFERIHNIDLSAEVIEKMVAANQAERPGMSWTVMDATQMAFDDYTFDVVIDKGTMDCIGLPPDGRVAVSALVHETFRVLKPAGLFMTISMTPHEQLVTAVNFDVEWVRFDWAHVIDFSLQNPRELADDAGVSSAGGQARQGRKTQLTCIISIKTPVSAISAAQGDLAGPPPNYGSIEYWDQIYAKEDQEMYDWLMDYDAFKASSVHSMLHKSDDILMLGSGSADFSAQMYDDGTHSIDNIDLSSVVIDRMRAANQELRPLMTWTVMDATELYFDPESYDVVIEKSTIDCLRCTYDGRDPNALISKLVHEAWRVLRPGGLFISLSLHKPDSLLEMVKYDSRDGLAFEWSSVVNFAVQGTGRMPTTCIVAMKDEMHDVPAYGSLSYWDNRYNEDDIVYDWVADYEQFQASGLASFIKPSDRVLMVGAGSAEFSADMYDDGFVHIHNIDLSKVVIQKMAAANQASRPLMAWTVMDALDLDFDDGCMDCAQRRVCSVWMCKVDGCVCMRARVLCACSEM